MATPIHAPRINNNDDEIKVLAFEVAVGDAVRSGQVIGQVETDKAALDVTAPSDGFVLGFVANPEDVVQVGSVLLWLGETAGEPMPSPADDKKPAGAAGEARTITAKAQLLLKQHGLNAEDVTPISGRVTVEAVEQYLASRTGQTAKPAASTVGEAAAETPPEVAGTAIGLTREERGMAATVAWHRDFPVTGYIELDYDPAPWTDYAKKFQDEHRLMLSPLLALMAWRLVEIAVGNPRLNATMIAGKRFEYLPVNLGFTVQAGEALYLAVIRAAGDLGEKGFVDALGEVQRRAAMHKLRETETSGGTIGFSSMERWKVTRHIPILAPQTSLMVAHAAGRDGKGTLGATYDHRILTGAQVVTALRQLSKPKVSEEK
jgi:pyruvate/2-oxoglutarate dehydrogenase complex dihydrolipoamide acyltransferase (E2) component